MESTQQRSLAPRRKPIGFVVLVLGCLVVPSLLQAAVELATGGRIEAISGLRQLALTVGSRQDFEQNLESRSWLVRGARRFHAPVVDELLQRGNPRVVFGRDGWLFFRQAVDYVTGPAIGTARAGRLVNASSALGDPRAVIVDFHHQLQTAGIELLVVPVPVKATLHPERLWPRADPWSLPNNPGFANFADTLEAEGVRVVDLAPALLEAKRQGASLFLARDTHWTPVAISIAADEVAAIVRELPAWTDIEPETEPFDHRRVTFSGHGDLYGMLAYAPWRRKLRPMRLELQQVIADRNGRQPRREDSPILLLGDSLTNVFSSGELAMGRRAGFAEQLASRLKTPLDVIAMPAGGASRSRQTLALRPAPLNGKRLVIWQFTQRDLLFAAEAWLTTPLDTQAVAVESPPDGNRRYELLAWLSETTRLPEKLDYADCLIVSRYRTVEGELPGDSLSIDVVQWGVRDWRATAAASYRTQEVHRLVLGPLPPEINLERTCWLDHVGLESRPWWVHEVEPQ